MEMQPPLYHLLKINSHMKAFKTSKNGRVSLNLGLKLLIWLGLIKKNHEVYVSQAIEHM